jgi:ethanolamine ammonia-lyase small subunit
MSEIIQNPWTRLRSFTSARLALGRTGDSLPTNEVLEFSLACAQARDAVHNALDVESLANHLAASGFKSMTVQSAVRDRAEYLRRPDLGRELNEASRSMLGGQLLHENCHFERSAEREVEGSVVSTSQNPSGAAASNFHAVFIVADGLSAIAPARHAVPVLREIAAQLEGWHIAPIIVATQARVALGDAIGALLKAEMTIMFIGERPGLSSPDSLGIYLTFQPRIGCTDADRNCISNVRPEGLGYEAAAHKLHHLMFAARASGRSGVALKDESVLRISATGH